MGSKAYSRASETERRKIANHMTHRPDTAFNAYSAKKRSSDALTSVSMMSGLMYGTDPPITKVVKGEEGREGSTLPSSAGALPSNGSRIRQLFSSDEMTVLEREVRRLQVTGRFVTMSSWLAASQCFLVADREQWKKH